MLRFGEDGGGTASVRPPTASSVAVAPGRRSAPTGTGQQATGDRQPVSNRLTGKFPFRRGAGAAGSGSRTISTATMSSVTAATSPLVAGRAGVVRRGAIAASTATCATTEPTIGPTRTPPPTRRPLPPLPVPRFDTGCLLPVACWLDPATPCAAGSSCRTLSVPHGA